jgi:2Fe-2S ferredoxin
VIDVYFVRNGSKIRVQVKEGLSAMEAAKFESPVDIPEIPADCGGNCMCCTCHVYVDEKWIDKVPRMDANSIEEEQLEYEKGYKPGGASRLSCQISLTPELDGLILHLRPDELL